MASTKEIKRRIKSVKSTKKITKAMELVAASKMKRAISQTLASRLYSAYSWELLTSLADRLEETTNKLFIDNEAEKNLIVLITSNRGLCGGYNSQIIKETVKSLKLGSADIITVGKKGDGAMRRVGQNVIASYVELPDTIKLSDIVPLSAQLIKEYQSGQYGNIYIAYTDFVSALSQKPKVRRILPVSKAEFRETLEGNAGEKLAELKAVPYTFEGEADKLLDLLAEKLIRMQIYQMLLESNASEQSARMLAMKNANEAAGEMIDDLTLMFNKARQAGITREISEISAGMASVS